MRNAMVENLSISLNNLSSYNETPINHELNKDHLESKLLKLIDIINLSNYNAKRGHLNA